MTKQDVIKNAYGEYWERVKDIIDKNGWVEMKTDEDKYNLLNDLWGYFGSKNDNLIDMDYGRGLYKNSQVAEG